jgi:hypothetical protein
MSNPVVYMKVHKAMNDICQEHADDTDSIMHAFTEVLLAMLESMSEEDPATMIANHKLFTEDLTNRMHLLLDEIRNPQPTVN